jgi:hypothetical protein
LTGSHELSRNKNVFLDHQNLAICSKRVVGLFPTRRSVQQALYELRDAGFPLNRVSVVVRDVQVHESRTASDRAVEIDPSPEGLHKRLGDPLESVASEGLTVGALSGGALGGLTGLLVGLGTLAIPGVGPVMLAGATATTIATTLAGSAIGAAAGSLLGALLSLGVSEDQARIYNQRVAQGDYLLIVDCVTEEVPIVETILHRRGIEEYQVYNIPHEAIESNYTTNIPVNIPVTHRSTARPIPTYSTVPGTVPNPVVNQDAGVDIGRSKHAIGIFSNRTDAESAVNDLRLAGFPLNQVSLVAENLPQPEFFAGIILRDRLDAMRLGVSAERARFYNNRLMSGEYVMAVSGTESEIRHAAIILNNRGIQELQMYDPTAITSTLPVDLPTTPNSIAEHSKPEGKTVVASPNPSTTTSQPELTTAPADYTLPTPSTSRLAPVLMNQKQIALGICSHLEMVETVLDSLQKSDFPIDRVSVIAKVPDQNNPLIRSNLRTYKNTSRQKRINNTSKNEENAETTISNLSRFLVGIGTFAIPGIGSVLVGGATATALVAMALSNGAMSTAMSGLTSAFVSLGISRSQAKAYNDRIIHGDYLILLEGNEDELHRVEVVLSCQDGQSWAIYDASLEHQASHSRGKPIYPDKASGIEHEYDRSLPVTIHPPQVTIIHHAEN